MSNPTKGKKARHDMVLMNFTTFKNACRYYMPAFMYPCEYDKEYCHKCRPTLCPIWRNLKARQERRERT